MTALLGPAERRRERAKQEREWANDWHWAAVTSGLYCTCEHEMIEDRALGQREVRLIPGFRKPSPECAPHRWIDLALAYS